MAIRTTKEEMTKIENEFYQQGYSVIAGIDESGCGPIAGPVVACAVVLPKGYFNPLVYDSKEISPKLRSQLYKVVCENAIDIGIGIASNLEIDRINIRKAVKLAMLRALLELEIKPEVVLVDGNFFDLELKALSNEGKKIMVRNVVKGDRKSISIASASIVAKVLRDEIMDYYDKIFPGYGFSIHKGYPTVKHLLAIRKLGVSAIHRKSYAPIQKILKEKQLGLFDEQKCKGKTGRASCS